MKKVKVLNSKLKMIAVFVAGLAVATIGWWQADRLNLAFGSDVGINEIKGGWIAAPTEKCNPSDKQYPVRKYDGCNIVITTPKCNPTRRYVVTTKTKSGLATTSYSSPVRNSREEVNYEKVFENKTAEFKSEYDNVSRDVESMKKTMPVSSSDYQETLKYKKELDNMVRRCMPVPTTTKYATPQKPVAR